MRAKRSIDRLPAHLKPYIVDQPVDSYTALDHAGWRFIMRVAKAFFKEHAHSKYLEGLIETGIETERIPTIEDMDICLSQFGWGAVPISGFIPPTVFLELLSLGIMPIAADMRSLEHLDYTPAPDIVHEAAGHAPIVADPEYAVFLHECGEMARKCIISRKDMNQHEAVRVLSDIKEEPTATPAQIKDAEEGLKRAIAANDFVSEATQLARFIWWTVEYGLVGDLSQPKIYGAGLLSSVAESYHCLGPSVKKIPLSIDCINQGYDITEPQPQLFVTPDFATLKRVSSELSERLAYKQGGAAALDKAVQSDYTATAVLDSGLQVSGVLASFRQTAAGSPFYLQFKGPTQLCFQDQELPGHDITTHAQGFGTPVGTLKATGRSPHELSEGDLQQQGWREGQTIRVAFSSGVSVEGRLTGVLRREGRLLLMSFAGCTVRDGTEVIFQPEWGSFDMGCGGQVISVFGGAADRPRYIVDLPPQQKAKTLGVVVGETRKKLCSLYASIRQLRESLPHGGSAIDRDDRSAIDRDDRNRIDRELSQIAAALDAEHPDDWLARLEIIELDHKLGLSPQREAAIRERLTAIGARKKSVQELIERGLALV